MTGSRKGVHYAWIMLGAVVLIFLAASGLRAVLGVFIKPMEAEFGWDRSSMSQVAALSLLLVGAVGPFVGWLADRWGPRNVMMLFLAVVAVGAMLSAYVTSLWQFYLTAGVLMALGAGGMGMATASTLAARWFVARRGLVMGILGAGMSAGQLVMIPAAVTRMSRLPRDRTTCSTALRTASASVTSRRRPTARRPVESIAASASAVDRRSVTTTSAPPRARAIADARPIPRAPPVTSATWPRRSAGPLDLGPVISAAANPRAPRERIRGPT